MGDTIYLFGNPNRKKRSDTGSIILSGRDVRLLQWMGDQYAIRFDHLQILAGTYSDSSISNDQQKLSYSATYQLSSRWVKAGLVERKKIFVEQPMWLWLTKKGLEMVGLDYSAKAPAISRLNHIHAVNAVRLDIESRFKSDVRWVPEREANAHRRLEGKQHLVDGEIEFLNGPVVAIEVELTQKRKTRIKSILSHLRREYDAIWYFSSDQTFNAIQNAILKVPEYKEKFVQHRLSAILEASA